jgi:hypothetical protein
MSIRRILLVAAAVACATGFASSASATVMIATYAGTVTTGQDLTGEFGSRVDLSGLSYVATFRYDTALGSTGFSSPPDFDERAGGSSYWPSGFASPILAGTLTLEGVTRSFSFDSMGDVSMASGTTTFPAPDTYGYFFAGGYNTGVAPGGDLESSLSMSIYTLFGASSLSDPFSGSLGSSLAPYSTGSFSIIDQPDLGVPTYLHNASATLAPETVSIAVASVPEPGTWALMLAGFAGLGAALRWQRRGAALAV